MNYTKSKYALLSILITFSVQSIDCASQKNVKQKNVVVVGNYGSGKSTLIASLITEVEKDEKSRIRIKENQNENNNIQVPEIIHKITAKTETWKGYDIPNENITIFDTQGLGLSFENPISEENKAVKQLNKLFSTKKIHGIIFMTKEGEWTSNYGNDSSIGRFIHYFFKEKSIQKHLIPSCCIVIQKNSQNEYEDPESPIEYLIIKNYHDFYNKEYEKNPDKNSIVKKRKIFFEGLIEEPLTKDEALKISPKDLETNIFVELKENKAVIYDPLNKENKKELIKIMNGFKGIPQQAFLIETSPLGKLKIIWNGYSPTKKTIIIFFVLLFVACICFRNYLWNFFHPESEKSEKPKSEKKEKLKIRSKRRKG